MDFFVVLSLLGLSCFQLIFELLDGIHPFILLLDLTGFEVLYLVVQPCDVLLQHPYFVLAF
jgi:hypothetical protein